MKKPYLFLILSLLFISTSNTACGQKKTSNVDAVRLVDSISTTLNKHYVFPDKAGEIEKYLKKKLSTQRYAAITDPNRLADKLIGDIFQVHIDPHMRIQYDPAFVNMNQGEIRPSAEEISQFKQYEKGQNYLFKKVEILPGNIGYVLFNGFAGDIEGAKPIVSSAFRFLSHTDAIIIDLRWNGGGYPQMVSYIESFFFEKKTPMNNLINRLSNDTTYFYADPAKSGGLTLQMPVYILTSNRTFSGAEDFSYGMQSLKRAIVIGETTGGGAHPVKSFLIGQGFRLDVPFARSWNPYTKTNWEGTGVKPDLSTSAVEAFPAAQKMILNQLLRNATDELEKGRLTWALNALVADDQIPFPDSLNRFFPSEYVGGLRFYKENGKYWCKNDERGGGIFQLAFIKDRLFKLDENAQVAFVADEEGEPSHIILLFQNGRIVEKYRIDRPAPASK